MHLTSDFCNRLSIASSIRSYNVIVRNSKIVFSVLSIIYKLGFVNNFKILNFKFLKVTMKFINEEAGLRGIFVLSKPSLKIFFKKKNLQRKPLINKSNSSGFLIVSTDKGLVTDVECVMQGIGGKALVSIY